jgi:hypothetical protein
MAETITNEKVFFDADKKFVDFTGLDYFWEKAKAYIDAEDDALEGKLNDLAGEGDGSVADQIAAAIAELDFTDAEESGKYVSSVSEVDGKISVTRADLPDFTDAIATAKSEAVAHADGLNTAMDARVVATEEHVANADIHVTTDDKANWNSAKTAIDNFLKDATLTGDVIDTLKEIQSYIDSDGEAADTMTKNIAANAEAIAANAEAIAVINGEADGSIAKAKADAIASAKTYTDETIAGLDLANTYEAKGTAAELDAALKTSLEGYADQAEVDAIASANDYTDALYSSIKFAQEEDIDALFPTVSE